MTSFSRILLFSFLLLVQYSKAQVGTTNVQKSTRTSSNYTHEFGLSAGFNYCRLSFFDAGLRYYHWTNDGQTILAFAGTAVGCEFSVGQTDQIYIPYIGWQGQVIMFGYGLRAEYAICKEKKSIGLTPELGYSLFEVLRITGGYRFSYDTGDPMKLSGFRFSLVATIPLSLLKSDSK